MRTFRFRPIERLEDRATPATLADMNWAYATTQANAAWIAAVSSDPGWMANPDFSWIVQQFTRRISQQSEAAAAIMADGAVLGQAEANGAYAAGVADWLGFPLVPPIPPPPPTDAGMGTSMPDVNSPSWQPLANGLRVWDVVEGNGAPVAAGDSITIFYSGWLAANGTQFDSRRSPLSPTTFDLDNLIQGWQQGIPGMEPGGIRRLYVPAALGYGSQGSGSSIPPNADLVFEIKVISHT